MSVDLLAEAIQSTRAVLATVRSDQLSWPTPCASWKVADVINHVVGGQSFFAALLAGQEAVEPPDFSAGDYVADFDAKSAACLAAFRTTGAMERLVRLPSGQLPGAALVRLAATDTFTHGWDLAKATGQPTDLAPALAAQLLVGARTMIQESFRGPDGQARFGPERTAPAGASGADKLAAFLGRAV